MKPVDHQGFSRHSSISIRERQAATRASTLFSLLLLFCTAPALATEKLTTDSYEITIEQRCPEGHVSCDNVKYTGVHRESGKSIRLTGRTHHTTCADGVSPCRFIGYLFRRGDVTYWVGENGYLSVKQAKKVLVEERGKWSGE